MVVDFVLMFIGILAAPKLSSAMEKVFSNGSPAQDFKDIRVSPPLFLANACALAALTFCCLPNITGHGLHVARFRAHEAAAFATAPTAILCVFESIKKVEQQVLFIPQMASLVVHSSFLSWVHTSRAQMDKQAQRANRQR